MPQPITQRELCQLIREALDAYREPDEQTMKRGREWWSPLWQVVRAVKGYCRDMGLDGFDSWRQVRTLVGVKRFIDADSRLLCEEDAAAAWADAWEKVRYLPGESLLEAALRGANANPVSPPRDRGPGYALFLALCAFLSRQNGEAIGIPLERWAELLNVRTMTMSTWCQWAVADGILALTCQYSHARRRAREYRVSLDRIPPTQAAVLNR